MSTSTLDSRWPRGFKIELPKSTSASLVSEAALSARAQPVEVVADSLSRLSAKPKLLKDYVRARVGALSENPLEHSPHCCVGFISSEDAKPELGRVGAELGQPRIYFRFASAFAQQARDSDWARMPQQFQVMGVIQRLLGSSFGQARLVECVQLLQRPSADRIAYTHNLYTSMLANNLLTFVGIPCALVRGCMAANSSNGAMQHHTFIVHRSGAASNYRLFDVNRADLQVGPKGEHKWQIADFPLSTEQFRDILAGKAVTLVDSFRDPLKGGKIALRSQSYACAVDPGLAGIRLPKIGQ